MPHIHEKIDFTVEVFIVHNGRVLLRKHDKYKVWLSVGGHIELDEDPVQAALREVKEEVGLDVELIGRFPVPPIATEKYTDLLPPVGMNIHRINDNHQHITLIYFAKSNTDRIVQQENERSEACRWFTTEELEHEEMLDNIRNYAKLALAQRESF